MAALELVRVNAGGASGGASSSTGSAMDDDPLDIDTLFEKVMRRHRQMERTQARAQDGILIISRVREQTRNVQPNDYTPHYVPIGPYHWSQRRIDEKLTYLKLCLDAFSWNTGRDDKKILLRTLLQEMKNLHVSSYYSDGFDGMGAGNEFHMLLLDGCYLLVCFADSLYPVPSASPQQVGLRTAGGPAAMYRGPSPSPQQGGLRTTGGQASDVKVRDTWYLLENQIPFVVVKRIYELVTGHNTPTPSAVLPMLAEYVKKQLQDQLYISPTAEGLPPSDPSHLLHLARTYFKPPAEGRDAAFTVTGRWRRATEYFSYANVRFHPQKLDSVAAHSVLDVSLEGGALRVPLLRVDKDTWTILRNLMALEEHHSVSLPSHVTAYCLFMSQLACTEEDVALLRRRRVVEHFLGSDAEAAAGFADLCKGVVLDVDVPGSNYLKPVWQKLERRYRSRWHNLVAWFRQTHCRNPWYFAAFVAAVILFVCQVLQGIYVIIDHKKK